MGENWKAMNSNHTHTHTHTHTYTHIKKTFFLLIILNDSFRNRTNSVLFLKKKKKKNDKKMGDCGGAISLTYPICIWFISSTFLDFLSNFYLKAGKYLLLFYLL